MCAGLFSVGVLFSKYVVGIRDLEGLRTALQGAGDNIAKQTNPTKEVKPGRTLVDEAMDGWIMEYVASIPLTRFCVLGSTIAETVEMERWMGSFLSAR